MLAASVAYVLISLKSGKTLPTANMPGFTREDSPVIYFAIVGIFATLALGSASALLIIPVK